MSKCKGWWAPFYTQVHRSVGRSHNGCPVKVMRGRHLSFSTVGAALARGEATWWPRSEEKWHAPTHGIAELDGVTGEARREARQRMRAGGATRHVTEPSALGIGDGATTIGGKRGSHRAQWRALVALALLQRW
jgi:hypothetical protein